jgi:hypothetical protein
MNKKTSLEGGACVGQSLETFKLGMPSLEFGKDQGSW